MEKLKIEGDQNSLKLKENFDKLKQNYIQYEENIQNKLCKSIEQLKKCFALIGQNERLTGKVQDTTANKVSQSVRRLIEQTIELLTNKQFNEYEQQEVIQAFDPLCSIREVAKNFEVENQQLKERVRQLEQELANEAAQTKDILPRYRDSMEKLKQNSMKLREKLAEVQQQKEQDQQQQNKQQIQLQQHVKLLKEENEKLQNQMQRLQDTVDDMSTTRQKYEDESNKLFQENKMYKQKIKEQQKLLDEQDYQITKLQKELFSKSEIETLQKPDIEHQLNLGRSLERRNDESELDNNLSNSLHQQSNKKQQISQRKQQNYQMRKDQQEGDDNLVTFADSGDSEIIRQNAFNRNQKNSQKRQMRSLNSSVNVEENKQDKYGQQYKQKSRNNSFDNNIYQRKSNEKIIKKEIFQLDNEIEEIQKSLAKELDLLQAN